MTSPNEKNGPVIRNELPPTDLVTADFSYDLPRLRDTALWVGALGGASDFYYAHAFWQHSVAEGVRGITGAVDRDLRLILPETTQEEATEGNESEA